MYCVGRSHRLILKSTAQGNLKEIVLPMPTGAQALLVQTGAALRFKRKETIKTPVLELIE